MIGSLRRAGEAVANLRAFQVRDNEVDAAVSRAGWRELLSLKLPADAKNLAVHKAQLEALIRRVPATVAAQFVAAALTAFSLVGRVESRWLILWLAASGLICGVRGARALRLRRDTDYAIRKPASARAITLIIAMLAGIWLIPAIFWFDGLPVGEQILLCALMVGLMSADAGRDERPSM